MTDLHAATAPIRGVIVTSFPAADRCWTCGVETPREQSDQPAPHTCQRDDVRRWEGFLEGWHDGYRFGIENLAQPLVQADRVEYGTGWAKHMRTGGIVINVPE